MHITEILKRAISMRASDIHITASLPVIIRINGALVKYGDDVLTPDDTVLYTHQILNESQLKKLEEIGEADLPFHIPGSGRFRVNAYKQRGSYSIAIRILNATIPTLDELGFPDIMKELAMRKRGLILVTGPTGSGKSTTLAAMLDHVNQNRSCHILTLEDPIEYMHTSNKCMVNQREIGSDTMSFANGLRSALREDPDVILVGEMRDPETIGIAITAAETGHLVMSTLHTAGAVQTVDRVIDVFPPHQQDQIRVQMAGVLQGVISQQLLPLADRSGRTAALEIMVSSNAISNMIREGKTFQIQTAIQTGTKQGMRTMDSSLAQLAGAGMISRETANEYAYDSDMVKRLLHQSESI